MNWRDYWNQDTPIYVSERHKLLHYALLAKDIAGLIPSPDATVLDYGCGEALSADKVAARCAHLTLCDAAPLVRNGGSAAAAFNADFAAQALDAAGMTDAVDRRLHIVALKRAIDRAMQG